MLLRRVLFPNLPLSKPSARELFAVRLKQARELCGLSQRALGVWIGLGPAAVADLAKNAPLLEACLVIAQLPKEEQAKAVEALRKAAGKKKSGAR